MFLNISHVFPLHLVFIHNFWISFKIIIIIFYVLFFFPTFPWMENQNEELREIILAVLKS